MIYKQSIKQQTGKRGFSLVETLVALSILLVSIVAPLTIASKSLQNIFFAREQLTATMLAQEGVEAVVSLHRRSQLEGIRDGSGSWDWFTSLDGDCKGANGCAMHFNDSASNPVIVSNNSCSSGSTCTVYYDQSDERARFSHEPAGGTDTGFTRAIRVTDVGNGSYSQVMVESEVSWTTALFPSGTSIIMRTTLFDVATTTI